MGFLCHGPGYRESRSRAISGGARDRLIAMLGRLVPDLAIVPRLPVALLACVAALSCGCGASRHDARSAMDAIEGEPLTASTYPDATRQYFMMGLNDPHRTPLRRRLVGYVVDQTEGMVHAHDYEAVILELSKITELYDPEEFRPNRIPQEVKPLAEFIAQEGSKRGDEGRVLAAYLVLSLIDTEGPYAKKYDQVAVWGQTVRGEVPDALQRLTALLRVWDEHAQLTPAPEVLERLAGLYTLRRDSVVGMYDGPEEGLPPQFRAMANRIWRLASLDVAAVFLAHGDVDLAIAHVKKMLPASEMEVRLLAILESSRVDDTQGADATMELVEAFQIARPEVAVGLCRSGLRRFPKDYRFPECLARIASDEEEHADATAWYLRAIELAPGLKELYDEALVRLDRFIETRLIDANPTQSRALSRRAEQVLTARQTRWPDSEPPLAPERLQYLIGMLEMNAGSPDEAKRRFEASLDKRESAAALLQLGILLERTGYPEQAEARYKRALTLLPSQTNRQRLRRAEILERLADTTLALGDKKRAEQLYRSALDMWSGGTDDLEGPAVAVVEIRRGVLLDQLGRHDDAVSAFQIAMAAAPRWRETYASILSHLVVSEPDVELAQQVWSRAQLQLALPPEWKVYFTLWIEIIVGRAGGTVVPQGQELLRRLGQSASWWGSLAKFGSGDLDYSALLSAASNLGEQTEAHFYEGARRMTHGDNAGALDQFQRVLNTHMVSFFEYEMARGLLRATKKESGGSL